MLPNTFTDIATVINSSDSPVLILFDSGECFQKKTEQHQKLENILTEHADPVTFYSVCVGEDSMKFPRIAVPMLYYFKPKDQIPAFWRDGNYANNVDNDLKIIKKMMEGMSYLEASSVKEEVKYLTVDYFEKEDLRDYPSSFQMARNLAKETFETGKRAIKGLPILVPASVGYERLTICEFCEFYDAPASRCTKCGCLMKTKTQLANSECPAGKWKKHT